jgi:surface polysaccharide O-acyltransferase-like enzyme
MSISKLDSRRIDVLRFPLIVGVVYIHAYEAGIRFAGGVASTVQDALFFDFVRNLLSQGVARVAVPAFFLISGYLFFLNWRTGFDFFVPKMHARIRTLFVPFLFWNVFSLLLYFAVQNLPFAKQFSAGRASIILDLGFSGLVSAILGIGRAPIAYQFWFIRDLMLLVLLAPLVGFAARRFGVWFIAALFVLRILDAWPFYSPSIEASAFFMLGAWCAVNKKGLFGFDAFAPFLIIFYIPIVVLDAVGVFGGLQPYAHRVGVLVGVAVALWLTKFLVSNDKIGSRLVSLSGCAFFVFAAHEPLLTILRKIAFKIIQPQTGTALLVLYILLPAILIFSLVVMCRILRSVAPGFMTIVTGTPVQRA